MTTQRLTLITAVVLAILAVIAIFFFRSRSADAAITTSASAASVAFSLEGQPALGDPNAPVKLAMFEDFKCPACKAFEEMVWPKLEKDYINTGKVQAHFVYFQIIDASTDAGIAGECVYHQSEKLFWDYKTIVYRSQEDERTNWATPEKMIDLAKTYVPDINADDLKTCLEEKRYATDIQKDRDMGVTAGVQGTPSLFVNGKKIEVTARTFDEYYDQVKTIIDEAVASGN
jgi:protein-disulfide isomerase